MLIGDLNVGPSGDWIGDMSEDVGDWIGANSISWRHPPLDGIDVSHLRLDCSVVVGAGVIA